MTRPIRNMAYCLFMVLSYEFFKRLNTSLTSLSKDFLQMSVHAVDSAFTPHPWILSSYNQRYSEHRQRHCPYKCCVASRDIETLGIGTARQSQRKISHPLPGQTLSFHGIHCWVKTDRHESRHRTFRSHVSWKGSEVGWRGPEERAPDYPLGS